MLEVEEVELEPGSVIEGRFTLVRILGEGGMGTVWQATDETTGEARALKFVKPEKEDSPRATARLVREAKAAMAIDHPSVLRVLEVGELPAGTPYLVMELLHGETLRARLEREGALPSEVATRLVAEVADGMVAAHALGVVHRDLKPENLFLQEKGGTKVVDFGVAKDLERSAESMSLTRAGSMLGTLHYMAPEQVYGDADVDTKADVWALGVILHECIAGACPTSGIGTGQIIKAITIGPTKDLATAAPACPKPILDLTRRMLARTREERPTMAEVAAALRGAPLVPVSAPPPSARAMPPRAPRRPFALGLVAITLTLAGGAAAVYAISTSRDEPLAPSPPLAPSSVPGTASTSTESDAAIAVDASATSKSTAHATAKSTAIPAKSAPTPSSPTPTSSAPATSAARAPSSAPQPVAPPSSDVPPVATIRH